MYPVVADVDGDGNAEIVAPANRTCSPSAAVGIAVIGDLHDRWVTARPLWNQWAYRIINVGDDAAVPPRSLPSWSGSNTFRANSFGNGSPFRAPDLKASYVRRTEDGTDLMFTVRVGNAGAGAAGAGVPVSLYNGDPRLGFPRLSTVMTTRLLRPGEFEDVVFRVASATEGEGFVFVGVDRQDGSASTVSECNEDDNVVGTTFYLNRKPEVDAGADSAITSPHEIADLRGIAERRRPSAAGIDVDVPVGIRRRADGVAALHQRSNKPDDLGPSRRAGHVLFQARRQRLRAFCLGHGLGHAASAQPATASGCRAGSDSHVSHR